MTERANKQGRISMIVGLISAVVAFALVSQGMKMWRARGERRRVEVMTAAWGLAPAARDRIQSVIEREMKAMTASARTQQLVNERVAQAKRAGKPADPLAIAKELGRELVARGVRRLPDRELEAMQQLRTKIAQASERTCVCFWDPAGCSEADILHGLAQLSEPDLTSWAQLSAAAGVAELEQKGGVASGENDLAEGLTTIGATLSDAERARFQAILDPADPQKPPAKDERCFAVRTMFAGAEKLPPPARMKFTRALFNAGAAP
jgi:hypothetical protein